MIGSIPRFTALVCFCVGLSSAHAGEPGRLEADADFLLGKWSGDCERGVIEIFLRDGALRQKGLLRVAPRGGGNPITPVTLLAATRDGAGVVLEARTEKGGFSSSARYTASINNNDELGLSAMTLCREKQCRTQSLEAPWKRCP